MISPIPADGTYVIEYMAVVQPIEQGTLYFASYKYGAIGSVIKDNFAPLVGVNQTQAQREDSIPLKAGSTTAQLLYARSEERR